MQSIVFISAVLLVVLVNQGENKKKIKPKYTYKKKIINYYTYNTIMNVN